MFLWVLAAAVTLIVLAVLFFAVKAARRDADAATDGVADRAHYRALLAEIETDQASGRISPDEAAAARAEIAREVVRLDAAGRGTAGGHLAPQWSLPVLLLAVGAASFVIYAAIGNPALPGQPLAERTMPAQQIDVDEAVARIEAQLEVNPDDARAWAVLGPIYMRQGRFEDAVRAYRRVLELLPASADAETDLAEAIMMAQNGAAEGEPLALLRSAAARDPEHVRSRFYLAGEATRAGEFEDAAEQWRALLALSNGGEPWVETARQGLVVAEAGLRGEAPPPASGAAPADPAQDEMIRGMVDGLAERLAAEGGSVDEWTRLVRAWLVLDETEKAQAAYDAAKAAYPDAQARDELDRLARGAGLE